MLCCLWSLFSQYYNFVAYFGQFILGVEVYKVVREIFFWRESKNLVEAYKNRKTNNATGMWAIVTGGSEGIGFEFARQLAQKGFNCILISRSEDKLVKAIAELKKDFANLDFKYLSMNFDSGTNIEFYKEIFDFVKDLDVCILVNNVGTAFGGMLDRTYEECRRQVVVNHCPQVVLANYFQRKFLQRKSDLGCHVGGAIVNLSSISKIFPNDIIPMYAATKKYNSVLSNASYYHFGKDLDILSLMPGYVITRMTGYRKKDAATVTTDVCVEGALRALGRTVDTHGAMNHVQFGSILRLFKFIPDFATKDLIAALSGKWGIKKPDGKKKQE